MKNKKESIVLGIIIFILLILDQIAKVICYKKGLVITNNQGGQSNNGYYIIISIIFIIMIIKYISRDNRFIKFGTKVALSFAIAGAMGNMIDRIWNKNVIVFIRIWNSLNLNLAYIYIAIAWVAMAAILAKNSINFLNDKNKKRGKLKK